MYAILYCRATLYRSYDCIYNAIGGYNDVDNHNDSNHDDDNDADPIFVIVDDDEESQWW